MLYGRTQHKLWIFFIKIVFFNLIIKTQKNHNKQWSACKAKVNCMHTRLKFTQPLDVKQIANPLTLKCDHSMYNYMA